MRGTLIPFLWFIERHFRKGVDAHMGIISSYMQGMEIKPEDRLIICDILPNKPGHVKTHVMCQCSNQLFSNHDV